MSKHTNQGSKSGHADGAANGNAIGAEVQPDKPEAGDRCQSPDVTDTNPDTAPENTAPVTPEAKIAELETRLAELNDQLLRKAADFENYRKRMTKEKQNITDFANQSLLLDLLPVIDDFGRAIRSAETSKDFASFYEGVVMIEKRLSSQLENKWGLKRFNSVGEPFDPNRHEALQMEKTAGITEPVVKEEYEKGYLLKERVVRFARVKVLMPQESLLSANGGISGEEGAGGASG